MATVLVVGSGGREHALVWKLAQSERVTKVLAAPGNPGMAQEPHCECVDIATDQPAELVALATSEQVELVVIGPEAPIAAGLAETMRKAGIACVAPNKDGAMLESSKSYCKQLLLENDIPTAAAELFDDYTQASDYVRTRQHYPVVIKASGLAAGKGVVIAENSEQAQQALHQMMVEARYADAGSSVVIEDYIEGEELSYIVLVDGETCIALASSQDHKRLLEKDRGPNTGGMGAYSPAPVCTPEVENRVMTQVIHPTLKALAERGIHYQGFLYAGIMMDKKNTPWVLEYNCRLGDPETQPLLMRMQSDLYPYLLACAQGGLATMAPLQWAPGIALGIVVAAPGYPENVQTGMPIDNLPQQDKRRKLFHAGTRMQQGTLVASGGRVVCATSLADTTIQAQELALQMADSITMQGKCYRRDIGWRAIG